ncbi:hypothetical protein ACTA71_006973, partial [Dictyostelium dimigraforme]
FIQNSFQSRVIHILDQLL